MNARKLAFAVAVALTASAGLANAADRTATQNDSSAMSKWYDAGNRVTQDQHERQQLSNEGFTQYAN